MNNEFTIKAFGEELTVACNGHMWETSKGQQFSSARAAMRAEIGILLRASGDDPADFAPQIEAALDAALFELIQFWINFIINLGK